MNQMTLSAAGRRTRLLENLQDVLGEGPCREALDAGRPREAPLRQAASWWPRFVPHAPWPRRTSRRARREGQRNGGAPRFAQIADSEPRLGTWRSMDTRFTPPWLWIRGSGTAASRLRLRPEAVASAHVVSRVRGSARGPAGSVSGGRAETILTCVLKCSGRNSFRSARHRVRPATRRAPMRRPGARQTRSGFTRWCAVAAAAGGVSGAPGTREPDISCADAVIISGLSGVAGH